MDHDEDTVSATYHHSLGRVMRNSWELWQDSTLKRYFNEIGIFHPDDMSGIIITSFQRHLKSEPIKLDEQVQFYKDFWENNKQV